MAAILLAWAALPLLLLAGRGGRRSRARQTAAAALAVLAAACFAAGQLAGPLAGPLISPLTGGLGPRAAVLLAACGSLAAGSEVWVREAGGDVPGWQVLGTDGSACPSDSVGLVTP